MDLKERIQMLCKEEQISMNQLEQELGFGKGYISKLGKSTPNATKIQQVADRFSVSVDFLLTGQESTDEKKKPLSEKDRIYLNYAKELKDMGIGLDELRSLIETFQKMKRD